jgi:hypothetical protein
VAGLLRKQGDVREEEGEMKRLVGLVVAVVVLAGLGAAASGSATASKGSGHVVGDFTADFMGFDAPGGSLVRLGSATVTVNASDRDVGPIACPYCPGLDRGTVTLSFDDGFVEATTWVFAVTNVEMQSGDTALVFGLTSDGFPSFFRFHDGGTPGSKIVGPVNSAGLFPTRDWFEEGFEGGSQLFTGFLTSGNIRISAP